MKPPREPFLGWPGWRLLVEALLLGGLQTAWWMFCYVGADWITGHRSLRVPVHFDVERNIPFIPAFIIVYRSIDVLFLIGPFVLRTRSEVHALVVSLATVTALATVGFLLVPAEVAYAAQPDPGFWTPLLDWNRRVVLKHNLLPSLHVALSTVTLAAYARTRGPLGASLLASWGTAIAASTLLIHAHHIADVVTGLLLGWAGYRLIYLRWLHRAAAARSVPPSQADDRASEA